MLGNFCKMFVKFWYELSRTDYAFFSVLLFDNKDGLCKTLHHEVVTIT